MTIENGSSNVRLWAEKTRAVRRALTGRLAKQFFFLLGFLGGLSIGAPLLLYTIPGAANDVGSLAPVILVLLAIGIADIIMVCMLCAVSLLFQITVMVLTVIAWCGTPGESFLDVRNQLLGRSMAYQNQA